MKSYAHKVQVYCIPRRQCNYRYGLCTWEIMHWTCINLPCHTYMLVSTIFLRTIFLAMHILCTLHHFGSASVCHTMEVGDCAFKEGDCSKIVHLCIIWYWLSLPSRRASWFMVFNARAHYDRNRTENWKQRD